MPSALLARRLRSWLWCQMQVVAGHGGCWGKNMQRGFIVLSVISACAGAFAQPEVRIFTKDDFKAYILPVDSEDRIAIRRPSPKDLAELSLLSTDSQHGGHIEQITWSDDHKYLVFTTTSSGGHSPWHFPTYVFSTDSWAFLLIDDSLPAITDKSFSFTDSSHITVQTLRDPEAESDDRVSTTIDLDALPWNKKKP